MCRFTAYLGPEIPLARIVTLPQHSLLEQSQHASEAKLAVNGDGFGLAWYGAEKRPGLYRDVLPAWADTNLADMCRMVRSHLFLAHIRASTVGETSRMNCHPFRHQNWAFMHNGQIGDFAKIRREMESDLPDPLYAARQGTTDSELLFLSLLAHGLNENPLAAVTTTLNRMRARQAVTGTRNRITCAFSDGQSIYAFRYSSDQRSPSLYIGSDLDSGGRVVASEPLDIKTGQWRALEESEFITLGPNGCDTARLAVA